MNALYDIEDIYEWSDYVRRMGIDQVMDYAQRWQEREVPDPYYGGAQVLNASWIWLKMQRRACCAPPPATPALNLFGFIFISFCWINMHPNRTF